MNLNTIVGLLISTLKLVGEPPLVAFLQTIYAKDAKLYGAIIAALNFALSEGQIAATKTATPIDDEIVGVLQEVVRVSAGNNGVVLL